MATDRSVEGYVAGLPDWRGDVVATVLEIVSEAAPDATVSIKWAQPVWESNGPFAYIKAFPKAVNFGFWRGIDLDDPDGRLTGDGDRMRHVNLTSPEGVDRELFGAFVRQAVDLNDAKGDPTRRGG